MPPRPLHHQLLLGREIFVTERMDTHLLNYGPHLSQAHPAFRARAARLIRMFLVPDYLSIKEDCRAK